MLKDVLIENLSVVFCGTAKGKASAKLGNYYAGPGNKFYSILYKAGFTPIKLNPTDCFQIKQYRIGLTDLVHIQAGNDKEIDRANYEIHEFAEKMKKYRPKFIAFTSKTAASHALGFQGVTSLVDYGIQNQQIGNSRVFVLPSTSGNARKFWNESFWRELSLIIRSESIAQQIQKP